MEILGEVHEVAAKHDAPMLGVQAHLQAGAVHAMCSNWIETLDELSHVGAHLDELVPRERASALLVRGLAALSLLDLEGGRRDLERAVSVSEEHGFRAQEFKARHNLGCLSWIAGDIPSALRLMDEAAEMDLDITTARGLIDHGRVLLDAGLVDDAEEVLERALDAARRDQQPLERGDVQLDLARAALLRGDHRLARSRAGRALRTFRALSAHGRADEVELFGAAVDLGDGRHLARAARVADKWRTDHPVVASERLATRIRVEAALARRDVAAARADLARLDPDQPQALGPVLHQRLLEARLASAEGDQALATGILRGAAAQLARDQHAVHSLEIRAGLAFHAARIREMDVSLAADAGPLPALFESVERWRAASHRAPPLRPATDPETADLVARLRRARQRGTDATGSSTMVEVAELQSAITQRLRATEGTVAEAVAAPATFTEAAAAAAVTHSTLVAFHEDRGSLVRLMVSAAGLDSTIVASVGGVTSLVARAISDVRAAALARPSMAPFLERARESSLNAIDTTLLSGLAPDGTVVVIPTVRLAALPWRALPSLRQHPVVASPSVTAWVRRSAAAAVEPTVAALAGPGLPRAREEVQAVASLWGRHTETSFRDPATRYAASASDVRSALATSSVVHLAAHGHHVEQSPLFSSLDMGDGPVFAHELSAPLAAELVILSACDVGRSRGRSGDEPLGLAAALLSLGVQCVVAATNPIHDAVADAAMRDLHNRLVEGVDVATALRDTAAHVPGAEAFCAYGSTWSRQMKSAGSRKSAS